MIRVGPNHLIIFGGVGAWNEDCRVDSFVCCAWLLNCATMMWTRVEFEGRGSRFDFNAHGCGLADHFTQLWS
jgi:hypothetical protein